MGVIFSSNKYDIAGFNDPTPTAYYAYNPTNTALFGIPGTLSLVQASATPTPIATFPVATGSATVTCSYRGEVLGPQYEIVPLECPMPVTSIANGTMRLTHYSYITQSAGTDVNGNTYSASVVTSVDGGASMLFGFFDPRQRPVLVTSTSTTTQTVTEGSAPATYTGAKSTKYVSCKTTKSSKSSSSSATTMVTSTVSAPAKRDVVSVDPVELIRITSTVTSGSTYKGPATKVLARTLHSGYAAPDVSYGASVAKKPATSITMTTTTTTTLADARTVATVTGCSTAALVTPTACATTQFTVPFDDIGPFNYAVYFSGTGVTEDPTTGTMGVAGPGGPIYIQSLPATTDSCGVITNCTMTAAYGYGSNVGTNPLYGSVDVHFDMVAQMWYCVGYSNEQTNAGVFSVKDANVGLVYGLSHYS